MGETVLSHNGQSVSATNPLPISASAASPVAISESVPEIIYAGQTVVATAGTEVVLGASQAIREVTIKATLLNTGIIYVGPAPTVSSATGFVLQKGESITIKVDNIADIYIDAATNGDGVSWIAS